jgi:hypothetical protein
MRCSLSAEGQVRRVDARVRHPRLRSAGRGARNGRGRQQQEDDEQSNWPHRGSTALLWFDPMLFKPIRVKLALRLRRCIRPCCELAHSPFGAMDRRGHPGAL